MGAQKAIEEFVAKELETKYFTHCFVACGNLESPKPTYSRLFCSNNAEHDIFDLASLTKALVTGPLIHQVLKEKFLLKEASIYQLLDDHALLNCQLPQPYLQLTFDELLGHYSGLPAWLNFWVTFLDPFALCPSRMERASRIAAVLTRTAILPMKVDSYSDVGYILLGLVLELSKGLSISEQFLRIKTMIGCKESENYLGFPTGDQLVINRCIQTSFCAVRQRWLKGEVHDENCASLGGITGHAGLFGNGHGVIEFLHHFVNSPLGQAYFEDNYHLSIHSKHEGLCGLRRGTSNVGGFAHGAGLGHLGFTGTGFWIDWSKKTYVILLTNRVTSGRVSKHIQKVRHTIFGALNELISI